METITKKEALEQGYSLFGYAEKEGWQNLRSLDRLDATDFEINQPLLASKEFETPNTSADRLKEMIADQMESDWGNDTGDDTEQVYQAINKLDFTAMANMINESVNHIKAYKLSKIKVILE